jgi:hypothetical protein
MKLRLAVPIGAVLSVVAIGLSQPRAQRGPVFTKDGNLVLPTGFREWVFIGGPITPDGLNNGKALFPEFHFVYVEPENFRHYQQHGNFPEGTVLVKELVLAAPADWASRLGPPVRPTDARREGPDPGWQLTGPAGNSPGCIFE